MDVVAVYTAAGRDELVETMHIERVSPWKLRLVDEQDIEPKIPPEDWQLVASHRFP